MSVSVSESSCNVMSRQCRCRPDMSWGLCQCQSTSTNHTITRTENRSPICVYNLPMNIHDKISLTRMMVINPYTSTQCLSSKQDIIATSLFSLNEIARNATVIYQSKHPTAKVQLFKLNMVINEKQKIKLNFVFTKGKGLTALQTVLVSSQRKDLSSQTQHLIQRTDLFFSQFTQRMKINHHPKSTVCH